MEVSSVIILKNINKVYQHGDNHVHALKGVNLEIETGAYVAIVGPSGSGKSTLLHILGGLETIDSGEAWINGKQVHLLNEAQLAKLRYENIGFVFQQFQLLPTATALENVMMPLLTFFSPARVKSQAEEALARVGLSQRLNHLPSRLSGGEQQRVAIARALVTRPRLILADEPTGNLDSDNSASIIQLLEESNEKDQVTVILVTHDEALANRAQRKIQILDGQIVESTQSLHRG